MTIKFLASAAILALLCAGLSGCGETFRGVGKDVSRIGYGVKTIFVSSH